MPATGKRSKPVTPVPPDLPVLTPAEPGDGFAETSEIQGRAFTAGDLSHPDLHAVSLDGCRLDSVRFSGAMRMGTIADCELDVCDLANLLADESSMFRCAISTSRLTGMSWTAGVWRNISVVSTRADLTSFAYSTLQTVVFRECDLRQADFADAEFRDVVFEDCDLSGGRFHHARIQQNVRFRNCTLTGLVGVSGLRGATVDGGDLLGLAACLAQEAGINVEW